MINTSSNTYFLKENLPIISGVYNFAGPINLNSNSINNVSWPSNDFDAVNKAYVLSVLTNGETVVYISTNELTIVSNNFYFSGDLILKDGQIWGLSEPMSNDNAATKLYVDTCNTILENQIISATNALATINSNTSSNFLKLSGGKLSGGKLSGSLSAPNINLYSSSNIPGYFVTGNSHHEANGFYIDNGTTRYGLPVYENENEYIIYGFPYYNGYYSYIGHKYSSYFSSFYSSEYVGVGMWYDYTIVSEHTNSISYQIDFAGGKAINLQDGIAPQDAATINQLENKITIATNSTINYIDNAISGIDGGGLDDKNIVWVSISAGNSNGDGSMANLLLNRLLTILTAKLFLSVRELILFHIQDLSSTVRLLSKDLATEKTSFLII